MGSRTIGRIKTVIPRTSAKFAILEPMTFPIAIPELPLKAAFKLTMSSGADVPRKQQSHLLGKEKYLIFSPMRQRF